MSVVARDEGCDVRGRDRFNADELAWIREQLVQLRVAERAEQKRIRSFPDMAGSAEAPPPPPIAPPVARR